MKSIALLHLLCAWLRGAGAEQLVCFESCSSWNWFKSSSGTAWRKPCVDVLQIHFQNQTDFIGLLAGHSILQGEGVLSGYRSRYKSNYTISHSPSVLIFPTVFGVIHPLLWLIEWDKTGTLNVHVLHEGIDRGRNTSPCNTQHIAHHSHLASGKKQWCISLVLSFSPTSGYSTLCVLQDS